MSDRLSAISHFYMGFLKAIHVTEGNISLLQQQLTVIQYVVHLILETMKHQNSSTLPNSFELSKKMDTIVELIFDALNPVNLNISNQQMEDSFWEISKFYTFAAYLEMPKLYVTTNFDSCWNKALGYSSWPKNALRGYVIAYIRLKKKKIGDFYGNRWFRCPDGHYYSEGGYEISMEKLCSDCSLGYDSNYLQLKTQFKNIGFDLNELICTSSNSTDS